MSLNELKELRKRIAELERLESQCRLAEKSLREAEAKYRSIFENAIEGVFQTTLDGHYLAANPALAHMMGYDTPEELMAKISDVKQLYIDPKSREELIQLLKTKGAVAGMEVLVRRKDGSPIWTSMNIRALLDPGGITVGFEGTVMDITERKRVQEKLQEAEIRYRALFCQSPDGVLIIDPQTAMALEFNEAAHRQLGYTRTEFKRLQILDYEAKENLEDIRSHIEKVLHEGRDDFETLHRTRDGNVRNIMVTVQALELSGRKVLYCIFRDITDLKRAEETLKNYAAEIEEANRLKDLFTDIMRHDLLNPLGVIKTASEQLLVTETKKETQDERVRDMLQMMERSADKLIDLINSASMYAMLESAEKLERKSLDLNEIFREVMNNFKSQLVEKNMRLEYISKGGCCVMANPMIDTVFSNLISNAIKYSPAGKKIEVNVIEEIGHFNIYVRDWGYGIKDEDKPNIFTRFHRADKRGVKGTGLGLAIVKRIVDLHGGKVWIEDNPEGGSVFCVKIPKDYINGDEDI